MLSKVELFNRTKEYMYAYKLEDLGVFSKQYMHYITLPKYSKNDAIDQYSIISIDFNNMNNINNERGYEFGNSVIHNVLDLIVNKTNLPKNSSCLRTGGDEFLIILDNTTIEEAEQIISTIHQVLDDNKADLYSASITAFAVDSENYKSLTDMLDVAEQEIGYQKKNSSVLTDGITDDWNIIEKQLSQTFNTFFKSLRLYNDTFNTGDLKQLYLGIINTTSKLLEKPLNVSPVALDEVNSDASFNTYTSASLDAILHAKNVSVDEIEKIDYNDYYTLLNKLVREPNTDKFTMKYFMEYLLKEKGLTLSSRLFSTAFVKLHNTLYSYSNTDKDIKDLMERLYNYSDSCLSTENKFNEDIFSDNSNSYFIDKGAGDFLILADSSVDPSSFEFEKYIDSNRDINMEDNNLLKLSCNNAPVSINRFNIDSNLITMTDEAKKNKNIYKIDLLKSEKLGDTLDILLQNIIKYYSENINKSDDMEQKTKFLDIASKAALDSLYEFNLLQKQNIKSSKSINER